MPRPLARTSVRSCLLAAIALAGVFCGSAAGQLRVVNYNVAQGRGEGADLAQVITAMIADDAGGFAVPVSALVFQEVDEDTFDELQSILGASFTAATYTNQNEDPYAGAQALFYDASVLLEHAASHDDMYTGAGRYADRWRLDLVGFNNPPVSVWIYSAHLKASNNPDSRADRLFGAEQIREDVATLPAAAHVIITGDMNFYTNSEEGYLAFVAAGPGAANDPLGTGSWGGAGNAWKHTQSPRKISADGLVGGGCDDRFDLQLQSDTLADGDGLDLIVGSIRSVGNDGQHYDLAINNGGNNYFPGEAARSLALANALHDASDHLPLLGDYQVPATLDASFGPDFGTVIEGADVTIDLLVTNTADVVDAAGAAVLPWTADGTGALAGSTMGSVEALAGPVVVPIAVDTSAPGNAAGSLLVTSGGALVQDASHEFSAVGTVIRKANASFSSTVDEDFRFLPLSFDAQTGVQTIEVPLWNMGWNFLQARLDIDAVEAPAAPFAYTGGAALDIAGTPATLSFTIDTDAAAPGAHVANLTIETSDEDLPGATTTNLTLVLSITIDEPVTDCPPDVDGDGTVSIGDLLAVLAAWGPCGDPCPEDIDLDGQVAIGDLLALLGAWGVCR